MKTRIRFPYGQSLIGIVLIIGLLALAGCGGSASTPPASSPTAGPQQPTAVSTPATTIPQEPPGATAAGPEDQGTTVPENIQAPTATGYPIKVYFSKYPDALSSNFQVVTPVDRISPTIMVGTFALQMLIAGPTPSEWDAGAFSELNSILTGPSNCSAPRPVGGPDFKLTLNMKGSTPEQGTATVTFCRTTTSPGVGADARITAEMNATLKQFPSIKKVVILTKDGHCFGDQSGKDVCLS